MIVNSFELKQNELIVNYFHMISFIYRKKTVNFFYHKLIFLWPLGVKYIENLEDLLN